MPFTFYKNLTSKKTVSKTELKTAYSIPAVKEAVFLASPTLYFEAEKWIENELDPDKEEKLMFSILKYLTRMSTRCTPFGVFAGCTTGTYGENTSIKLASISSYKRHTRLDMNYLVALSQDLAKIEIIKKQLLFYPNSSLYHYGHELRYVEYNYVNSKRNHYVSGVDYTKYLSAILKMSSNGSQLVNLATFVSKNYNTSFEDATSFLDELVSSQILISDLEPSVSGPEFLEQIIRILSGLENTQHYIKLLQKIDSSLTSLDKRLGNKPKKYIELSKEIEKLETSYDLKYLYQADMEIQPKHCSLSVVHLETIRKGIDLLNKLSIASPSPNLMAFKESFRDRYEDREVPLAQALDVESGIGYLQNQGSGDLNPLVDNLVLPDTNPEDSIHSMNWNSNFQVLFDKITDAHRKNIKRVVVSDEDFKNSQLNWTDLPDTISTMIEIIIENGTEKIICSGAAGSSAANLLARFGQGNEEIKRTIQEVTTFEQAVNSDKILAEIVHLPESRIGNILSRPTLRTYEIPYLAKSLHHRENQITLDDLFISIRNDKIFLRSKKWNKEVLPRLTNAHNYSFNSLPIYHFLCDMQSSNLRNSIGFTLGPITSMQQYLPRIEYENLILHEARWTIKKEELQSMFKEVNNNDQLVAAASNFRAIKDMPQLVLLVEGDNELLINFENVLSIKMFLNEIKNRTSFVLKEFLYGEDGVVNSKNGRYTNQIVISFYNSDKAKNVD